MPDNPSTILSVANDIRDISRSILRRSGSMADCLGGSQPECSEGGKADEPADLHGVLQRVVSLLSGVQDELYRSERVIGIATPIAPVACQTSSNCAPAKQGRY